MKRSWIFAFVLTATCCFAQTTSDSSPPAVTMKQLMLDLIHPASNGIFLVIFRGGPKDENEWAAVRHNALTLAASGESLNSARAGDPDWTTHVEMLVDAGTAAYKAAEAKNVQALAAVAGPLDASCTSCHKQYRPNVFPPQGGSK